MVLAIAGKELRELRIFAALSLAIFGVYLCKLTGHWSILLSHLLGWLPGLGGRLPDLPFLDTTFTVVYGFVGFSLALALGFRQSLGELVRGTAPFLLHRPMSRRRSSSPNYSQAPACSWRARRCRLSSMVAGPRYRALMPGRSSGG